MNARAQGTAVLDALALRGFEFLGPSTEGLLVLRGDLATSVGAHRCEVEVDPNFLRGRVESDWHMHQPKTDRAFPYCTWHGAA